MPNNIPEFTLLLTAGIAPVKYRYGINAEADAKEMSEVNPNYVYTLGYNTFHNPVMCAYNGNPYKHIVKCRGHLYHKLDRDGRRMFNELSKAWDAGNRQAKTEFFNTDRKEFISTIPRLEIGKEYHVQTFDDYHRNKLGFSIVELVGIHKLQSLILRRVSNYKITDGKVIQSRYNKPCWQEGIDDLFIASPGVTRVYFANDEISQMPQSVYTFTVVVSDVTPETDDIEDMIFEAGCDDGLVNFYNNKVYIDFERKATSLKSAVASVILDMETVGLAVNVSDEIL